MAKRNQFGTVCAELLTRIHDKHPLIHHITNFVVMNDTANATLALGALPVMAHAKEEVAEMVGAAGALVLNPGTLTPEWVEAMLIAGSRANELGVPIVYDPVGVGATKLRNETGAEFLNELRLAVVRGNSGEMGALAGAGGVVKGVESVEGSTRPGSSRESVRLETQHRRRDHRQARYHFRWTRVLGVDNGHVMLKTITGTGCMATTTIAIFCAVEKDFLVAATAALACYGLAAQRAARAARGTWRVSRCAPRRALPTHSGASQNWSENSETGVRECTWIILFTWSPTRVLRAGARTTKSCKPRFAAASRSCSTARRTRARGRMIEEARELRDLCRAGAFLSSSTTAWMSRSRSTRTACTWGRTTCRRASRAVDRAGQNPGRVRRKCRAGAGGGGGWRRLYRRESDLCDGDET